MTDKLRFSLKGAEVPWTRVEIRHRKGKENKMRTFNRKTRRWGPWKPI